ncbi:serine hydrolase [Virgibacillus saliphilus]|uniref:serine hydrolase n=1 Tax=Virgibacillus saliphilus TaxID=2831674 RepID=UPI002814AE8B|nr:serine hydrolase [Virgibacillus sp. NKC19-3]
MKQIKKRLLFLIASLVLITSVMVQPFSTQAADTLDLDAESAILVDAETGKILYAKDPDVALPPASMTKMMTEYLVLEAIDSGDISWDTTAEISDYAYSISANASFSGVGLEQDKEYTVHDLYDAMAVNSDNATTIALAELIAGTETEFVALMNEKADELGLPEYKFVNSTGLDNSSLDDNRPEGTDADETNLLSAESSALLAYHLVNKFPEALEISSQPEIEFEGESLDNWNWMLPHEATFLEQFYYEGMDGLKTGNTDLAGYTFTGTAERNGKRLISVVMKTESEAERFNQTEKLMDYGFEQFETTELFPAGYQVENESSIPVAKGKEDALNISTAESFTVPIKSGEEEQYSVDYTIDEDYLNEDGALTAPIEEGESIGTAELVYDGEADYGYIFDDNRNTVDLVANESVEKSNWFMLTLGAIGDFFANLFTSSVDWIKGLF